MRSRIAVLVTALVCLFAATSWAQDFPDRSITLIIPTAPGGSASVSGQIIAEALKRELKQSVLIVYKAGAAQAIGTEQVLKSRPDGYTLGWTFEPDLASKMVADGKNLSFDKDDLTHLGAAGFAPYFLWVKDDAPWQTLEELVAAGKQKPVSYGSSGVATMGHLYAEMFVRKAGMKATHVPYPGGGPATTALLGGHVDMSVGSYGRMKQYMDSNLVRPLAILVDERLAEIKGVPTLKEKGLDLPIQGQIYHHLFGPKGLPPAVVQTLVVAFERAVRNPQTQQSLVKAGFDGRFLSAKATEETWLKDFTAVEKVIAQTR
jgi:tripartite-type tricarboxylate transporter receptor subunit TctC